MSKKILLLSIVIFLSSCAANISNRMPDTDFGTNFSEAVTYETNSLLMKFNLKTNDLNIGPYSGTWKNRKSSSKFMMFGKRKTSTDITLIHDTYGTWTIFCSGLVKEFELFGFSTDRENEIDYQCVMQSGEQMAVLEVFPYKKPKFLLGEPIQNRKALITLPDGRELHAVSLHRLVGNKREYPQSVGYTIKNKDKSIGGLGRFGKKNVILISSDVASTADEHFVFMSGLGLWFFGHNDGKSPLD